MKNESSYLDDVDSRVGSIGIKGIVTSIEKINVFDTREKLVETLTAETQKDKAGKALNRAHKITIVSSEGEEVTGRIGFRILLGEALEKTRPGSSDYLVLKSIQEEIEKKKKIEEKKGLPIKGSPNKVCLVRTVDGFYTLEPGEVIFSLEGSKLVIKYKNMDEQKENKTTNDQPITPTTACNSIRQGCNNG